MAARPRIPILILALMILLSCTNLDVFGHRLPFSRPLQHVLGESYVTLNGVPHSVREQWMRRTNTALAEAGLSCATSPYASIIVNHTASETGTLVCMGVNAAHTTGDPTLHGEIAAIRNCTSILTSPTGPYNFTPIQAQAAFADLTLYTNAESCPMCASAIRLAGFREYVYGTSIPTLIARGWGQIRVSSAEIFRESFDLPHAARLLGGVLAEETDPLFSWQFNPDAPCPVGCVRPREGGACRA